MNVILAGTVLIALLIGVCYQVLSLELDLRAKKELTEKLEQIVRSLTANPAAIQSRLWQEAVTDSVAGHTGLSLRAIDSKTGKVLLQIGTLNPTELPEQSLATPGFVKSKGANGIELLTVQQLVDTLGNPPLRMQLTLNRSADRHLMAAFIRSAAAAIPMLLLLIGFAGWLVSYQGLKPLRRFQSLAAKVSAQNLSPRIHTASLPTELEELASSLNLMLHRLDTDVQKLSQFSDDVAHELRAPLNNLLGRAQVVLSRERRSDEYRDALASSIEELERLNRIATDMLFLAQVSHAEMALNSEPISLEKEASKVCSFMSVLAEERDITLQVQGAASVDGDRLMIQRALSNLISNALRHSNISGEVVVSIMTTASVRTTITVTNTGSTIAPEHLPHLFERFYRVGKHNTGSTGLGLAIVRSIMRLHGGDASVWSQANVTKFILTFPR